MEHPVADEEIILLVNMDDWIAEVMGAQQHRDQQKEQGQRQR